MKVLTVYSSLTGNTKMIAEAIQNVLPQGAEMYAVADAPDATQYDYILLGFWVDKGKPDAKMERYMATVQDKQVGLFGTLGAWPDSDHARQSMQNAVDMLPTCTVQGTFICQGKVDPKLITAMDKMIQSQPGYDATSPEQIQKQADRKARIEAATMHPDQHDCVQAQQVFKAVFQSMLETQG